MTDIKIEKEKKVMKRFLREVTKTENGNAIYGETHIRKALEMGAVDTLLISENLRKYRIILKCNSCNYDEVKTVDEKDLEDFTPPICKNCDTSVPMEMKNKVDLIDELSDLAEETGANVVLISPNSEEGDSLSSAFNGIAAITRYPIDF